MELHRDFRELLASFSAHGVEFVLVGAYALALLGAPRYTGDLDLYVRPTEENARRILAALGEFGFGSLGLSAGDFAAPDRVVQLGVPPLRVDLVTSLTGVSWEQVWQSHTEVSLGGTTVPVIARAVFLRNKRAIGRPKDLADAEMIEPGPGRGDVGPGRSGAR